MEWYETVFDTVLKIKNKVILSHYYELQGVLCQDCELVG
jgi:hypothetical protein